MKIAITTVCTFLACTGAAIAEEVDWKFYGSAENKQQCFYDAKSVSFQSVGHMRIWTKCLNSDEMEAAASSKTDKNNIIELATNKILGGYVPPLAKVFDFPWKDQLISVVLGEITANLSSVQPTVTIYWELICSEKMMRVLQLSAATEFKEGCRQNGVMSSPKPMAPDCLRWSANGSSRVGVAAAMPRSGILRINALRLSI
jgi:hypothetical protein